MLIGFIRAFFFIAKLSANFVIPFIVFALNTFYRKGYKDLRKERYELRLVLKLDM